jgi:hypothetical protein
MNDPNSKADELIARASKVQESNRDSLASDARKRATVKRVINTTNLKQ